MGERTTLRLGRFGPRPGESAPMVECLPTGVPLMDRGPGPDDDRGLLSLRRRGHSEEPDDRQGPLLLRLAPMVR